MIIATIGSAKLKLETLEDAEDLLKIASRAKLVQYFYDSNYRDRYYIDEGEKRITIEVIEGDKVISYEEFQAIQAEKEAKKLAKAA